MSANLHHSDLLKFTQRVKSKCGLISHCGLNLHFPDGYWCTLFICLAYSCIFLKGMSVQIMCPFFYWAAILISCEHSSYILETGLLSSLYFEIFLPFYALPFSFLTGVFWRAHGFSFDEIQLNVLFYGLYFCDSPRKSLSSQSCKDIPSVFSFL